MRASKNIILLIVLAAILSGTAWVVLLRNKPGVDHVQAHKDVYYCPMHPHYTSDHPGNCPICGMTLVKQHYHQQAVMTSIEGYAPVTINAQQRQWMGVKTVMVHRQILIHTVRVPGYVAPNQLRSLNYRVTAQIFESDRGFVEVGQIVDVDIPAYHEHAKGRVRSIGRTFDPQTRTVNVSIELSKYRGELNGNMFVNVSIPAELNEYLMVPATAVMDTGLRTIVYVEVKPGIFEPREIQVVAQGDNGYGVKSGLAEGDIVAVEGNFLLDSESRVQAGLQGEGQSHD